MGVDELRVAIEEARRKQITVLTGTPYTEDELAAIESELGVRLPADYRAIALAFGMVSFRKDRNHWFTFGKQTIDPKMDLLVAGREWQAGFGMKICPLAAKLDHEYGHLEFVVTDANGAYRQYFDGGSISEPRSLVDVDGMFPYYVMMYRDDGTRRSGNEMMDLIGVIRV